MGDFCTPTDLAQWLKAASTAREWSRNAVASGEAQADPPGLSYSEATPESLQGDFGVTEGYNRRDGSTQA